MTLIDGYKQLLIENAYDIAHAPTEREFLSATRRRHILCKLLFQLEP